jgi:probable phosphomutase (TIGR03848 family)
MALLFLIRHGVTDQTGKRLYGRSPDVHLSDLGREQAEALAARFDGVRLRAVYASPLERCLETAAPLAAAQRLETRTSDGLLEVDYGSWTGRPLANLARTKLWPVVQQLPSQARFPGGESLAEAAARMSAELLRIADAHPRGRVAVVTHGDPIRLAISDLAGAHIDQFQRIMIEPGSVSVVGLRSGALPRIFLVNDTGDLSAYAAPRQRPGTNLRG